MELFWCLGRLRTVELISKCEKCLEESLRGPFRRYFHMSAQFDHAPREGRWVRGIRMYCTYGIDCFQSDSEVYYSDRSTPTEHTPIIPKSAR